MDNLVALKSTVQKSRRFAEAILTGSYPTDFLASRNRSQIETLASECDEMDEAAFHELLRIGGVSDVRNSL